MPSVQLAQTGHLQTHTVTFQFNDGLTPYICLRTGAAAGRFAGVGLRNRRDRLDFARAEGAARLFLASRGKLVGCAALFLRGHCAVACQSAKITRG